MVAILTTAFEAVAQHGRDNLWVPLGTLVTLNRALDLPIEELSKRLVVLAAYCLIIGVASFGTATFSVGGTLILILAAYASWTLGSIDWALPALLAVTFYLGRILRSAEVSHDRFQTRVPHASHPFSDDADGSDFRIDGFPSGLSLPLRSLSRRLCMRHGSIGLGPSALEREHALDAQTHRCQCHYRVGFGRHLGAYGVVASGCGAVGCQCGGACCRHRVRASRCLFGTPRGHAFSPSLVGAPANDDVTGRRVGRYQSNGESQPDLESTLIQDSLRNSRTSHEESS